MALSGLLAFASVNLGARTVPIVASVVLHAGLAAGLVATASGHANVSGKAPAAFEMTVDVEAPETAPPPPPETPVARNVAAVAVPAHTHPYPVDPSHDARPHDPSIVHERAHDHDDHHDDHAAAPSLAAPALTADPAAALPKFDLGTGTGSPSGGRVSAGAPAEAIARGGSGAGTGSSASDDVVHAASAVQVPARLVQSVTPAYPAYARADDVEGDVGVEIVVVRDGRVLEARVVRPAGHGFDAAALAAVRAYRFSPAQREGHAVRVRMPWSVQFRLR